MKTAKTQAENRVVARVFMYLSLIAAGVLLVAGSLALWANQFTTDMVRTELAAQKIYFPEKGSAALDPAEYPDLQQYAGGLVDTPEEAKAYANGYIGRHLENASGGKTYAEISSAAMKDPTNTKLQQQKATLFQGETIRGILLGTGYAFGTVGKIAGIAATVFLVSAVALLGATLILRSRL